MENINNNIHREEQLLLLRKVYEQCLELLDLVEKSIKAAENTDKMQQKIEFNTEV